ncbi:DUF6769 family protein [Proteiniphilum sp. X52]|uniref:DUF6769 family protein n=1 Tax=Proteiniphilum sp. X52 TaxID=2382159 RepID=UPI000F0A34EB|nr:DUF6769 family protein [Proteiniphilum sp. X52]RNC64891.1 hypothetical protein D7D25_09740 [Proteiniphilum sp. X52]
MKKKIAISSIAVAVLIVLVAGTIPHHHHDNGAICFHMTHHQDASEDGQPPAQSGHSCHHDPTCIAETTYYTNPDGKIKIKAPSLDNGDNPGHIELLPLLYLVTDFLVNPAYDTYTKPKQGEYILSYKSAEVSRFHGLRAPPFILS